MKFALWIIGPILIITWLGALIERGYNDSLRILIVNPPLFLGLSILLGAWMIAMSLVSKSTSHQLSSDYLTFLSAIGDQALSMDELAQEVGKDSIYSTTAGTTRQILTDRQNKSLQQLIFDGKICLRNERYSLPGKS